MADLANDPCWRLYVRALDILEGRTNGHALPILRKLARRGFPPAVNLVSDYLPEIEALALLRRAARAGDPVSAYNLAITYRNRGDMSHYRQALARAARLDADAADELRRFKTRFPEAVMRRLRKLEPRREA